MVPQADPVLTGDIPNAWDCAGKVIDRINGVGDILGLADAVTATGEPTVDTDERQEHNGDPEVERIVCGFDHCTGAEHTSIGRAEPEVRVIELVINTRG